jgi:hypothetical protein
LKFHSVDRRRDLCDTRFVIGETEDTVSESKRHLSSKQTGGIKGGKAVEDAFGADIDYAQLQKIYGAPTDAEMRRYGPVKCIGADQKVVSGDPDPNHVSTGYLERHNLTMRMGMRRFTRPTNGFSKKIEKDAAMVAIHAMYYISAESTKRCGLLRQWPLA